DKPLDGPQASDSQRLAPAGAEACPLPAWVPPSRRLGGFFVVRALGTGLASSVFLVKRTEQRADASARELVLKVARYDARRARILSEAEYEAAFARELPALLSVPPHENLAAFVAVEPAAQPKPFLVMEWIDGPTLARVRKRKLAALDMIDGILAGLEVLHARGIGHLDLCPRNVVLRMRDGAPRPVLVDFACAGRHVRAGVGHAAYAAPELWSELPSTPMAVDVYALGCLAYELVTGRPLFEGTSEPLLAAEHMHHDGTPPGVAELQREARTTGLAEWLTLSLRADPRSRADVTELRAELRRASVG
ncbi:MAG: protein kinase, partial [Polyangiales bacterium]